MLPRLLSAQPQVGGSAAAVVLEAAQHDWSQPHPPPRRKLMRRPARLGAYGAYSSPRGTPAPRGMEVVVEVVEANPDIVFSAGSCRRRHRAHCLQAARQQRLRVRRSSR